MNAAATLTHIFVQINKDKQEKVEFDHTNVTGLEIKEKAGVPLGDDLALRVGEKLEQIANDQSITIKNGEHFVALPPGTIS
jgi:hypothetical protein